MSLSLSGNKHKSRGFAISAHVIAVVFVAAFMGLISTVWVQQDGPWKLLSFRLSEHTDMRPMVTLAQIRPDDSTIVIGSAEFMMDVWEKLPQEHLAPVHLPQPDRQNVDKLLSLIDNRGLEDKLVIVELREEMMTDFGRPETSIVTSPEMGVTPIHAGAIRIAFASIGRSVLNGQCCEPLARPIDYSILHFTPFEDDSPIAERAKRGKLVFVTPAPREALDLTNEALRNSIETWATGSDYKVVAIDALSADAVGMPQPADQPSQ